jgi:hypothetical protein
VKAPNLALRRARLRLASPHIPGRRLSRQELAEAVNAHVFAKFGRRIHLDGSYIGKLERGTIRWPRADCRNSLRNVLGAATDAEIGFYSVRRNQSDEAFIASDPVMLRQLGAAHLEPAGPATPLPEAVAGLAFHLFA